MDYKTLATILFRVLGVSYFFVGAFYTPYFLVDAAYNNTFIISGLAILTYFGAGLCLFLLSRPLAALAVIGLDRKSMPPPPPPPFANG
jgi:hypothetical protein